MTSRTKSGRFAKAAPAPSSPESDAEEASAMLREAQYRLIQQRCRYTLEGNAPAFIAMLDTMQDLHEAWFTQMQGFNQHNFHGDCMLIVTELAEAVEADRKDDASEKIPGFHGREEEVADALVRILHLAGKYRLRLGRAFFEKMLVNLERPYRHGKEY